MSWDGSKILILSIRDWILIKGIFDQRSTKIENYNDNPEKDDGRWSEGYSWLAILNTTNTSSGTGAVWNHFHLNLLWRLAFEIGCCCRGGEKHNIGAEEIVLVLLLLVPHTTHSDSSTTCMLMQTRGNGRIVRQPTCGVNLARRQIAIRPTIENLIEIW